MDYAYPCILTPEDDGPGYVVTFPDVPEAVTGGATRAESLVLAEDAIVVALSFYVDADQDLPAPSPAGRGQELITVPPHTAAQLALYKALRREGMSVRTLAWRQGQSTADARRLLDFNRPPPLREVLTALRSLGRTLLVGDRAGGGAARRRGRRLNRRAAT